MDTVMRDSVTPVTLRYLASGKGSNSTWLDSTRLDTFDFVEPVEQVETSVSSETSRAFPTWRTTNDLIQV